MSKKVERVKIIFGVRRQGAKWKPTLSVNGRAQSIEGAESDSRVEAVEAARQWAVDERRRYKGEWKISVVDRTGAVRRSGRKTRPVSIACHGACRVRTNHMARNEERVRTTDDGKKFKIKRTK